MFCFYAEQGLCNGMVFIRLSVAAWAANSLRQVAAVGPAGRRYWLTAAAVVGNVGSATLSVYKGSKTDLLKFIEKIILTAAEKLTVNQLDKRGCQLTDMCVFESSHVVCPIPAHQRRVSESLQCRYHKLLLFGRHASIHFDVRQ